MSIDIYLQKSEENFKTGEWAERKSYYDIAVSRFYYCIYQKIIYISKKRGIYLELETSKDSHVGTINTFITGIEGILSGEEKIEILKMKNLRRLRNTADYKDIRIEQNDYGLSFKYSFNNINEIIDRLL